MSNNILCFLCLRPDDIMLSFISELKNDNYDVYVSIDDNNYIPDKKWTNIKFIQINNDVCHSSGYRSVVAYFDNKSCSKDKALYYFNNNKINYDYIWLIEDDVFIPSIDTIKNIDIKYPNYDFLTQKINHNLNLKEWNWKRLIKLQFHWLYLTDNTIEYFNYDNINYIQHSMTCVIRLSNNYMSHVNKFVDKYNSLFMDELFFAYICNSNNLSIKEINELSNIHWYHVDWELKDINIDYLYHPIKNFKIQDSYRKYLNNI